MAQTNNFTKALLTFDIQVVLIPGFAQNLNLNQGSSGAPEPQAPQNQALKLDFLDTSLTNC